MGKKNRNTWSKAKVEKVREFTYLGNGESAYMDERLLWLTEQDEGRLSSWNVVSYCKETGLLMLKWNVYKNYVKPAINGCMKCGAWRKTWSEFWEQQQRSTVRAMCWVHLNHRKRAEDPMLILTINESNCHVLWKEDAHVCWERQWSLRLTTKQNDVKAWGGEMYEGCLQISICTSSMKVDCWR